jgi:hypothetical protein
MTLSATNAQAHAHFQVTDTQTRMATELAVANAQLDALRQERDKSAVALDEVCARERVCVCSE